MADDFDDIDPFPDVHALFLHYNKLYFDDCLGACSVEWSSNRMTLCAGVCQYERGGGCRIKLSEPLLKFRPTLELKETLLHEMIHAWMFLQKIRDQGDHGPRFQERMNFINRATFQDHQRPAQGYNITVFHSMHAEVDQYRTHHWQCPKCSNLVKRAMNRPPQEADCRGRQGKGPDCKDTKCAFHMHQRCCGGQYIKIAEPEGYGKKGTSKKSKGAFADGTALPAKRPRTSNLAEPDASRSNRRVPAITDFFDSISATNNAPECEESQRKGVSTSNNLAASNGRDTEAGQGIDGSEAANTQVLTDAQSRGHDTDAVNGWQQEPQASNRDPLQHQQAPQVTNSAAPSQQMHQQPQATASNPPEYASRRDMMADAAMRRLAVQNGVAVQSSASIQNGSAAQAVDAGSHENVFDAKATNNIVNDKHSDQDEGTAHVSAVIDLIDDESPGIEHLPQTSQGQSSSRVQPSCPICGHVWPEQTSNQEMNDHVDACLMHQIL